MQLQQRLLVELEQVQELQKLVLPKVLLPGRRPLEVPSRALKLRQRANSLPLSRKPLVKVWLKLKKLPKTKFGDAYNPQHATQINELTKKNMA